MAFTAVSNALGTVNPVAEMTAEAHAAGASVLVDAAQGVPVQPMDVQALDCDFLAFSGHKVFGPTGIGVLYGKEGLLDAMPPAKGGGDMILSVTFEKTTYNALPYKFEAGTAHIAGAIGLGRALEFASELGTAAIEDHEAAILADALAALQAIDGVRLVGTPSRRKGIISFLVDEIHPHDLGTIAPSPLWPTTVCLPRCAHRSQSTMATMTSTSWSQPSGRHRRYSDERIRRPLPGDHPGP